MGVAPPPIEITTSPAASTRRRTGGRRSRTGCRTCRARHKKCDETPGACTNCTSTGRTCDGYEFHRLPREVRRPRKAVVGISVPASLTHRIHWVMSPDEQRSFAYFQHQSMPAFLGWFDSSLWQKLLIQLSHAEPAVYHAAVALSAVHQDAEKKGMPLAREDLDNTWHRFALEQAGRSISLLNARRTSQDPCLREVTLLCCLLFTLFELLRGRYDDAFRHLHGGIHILKSLGAHRQLDSAAMSKPPVEWCLVEAFAHLDVQSSQFGVGGPIWFTDEQDHIRLGNEKSTAFQTLAEARQAFDRVMGTVLLFTAKASGFTHSQIASDYERLYKKQLNLCLQIDTFAQAFNTFRTKYFPQLSPKQQRGADIIHLHQRAATLILQTCLLDRNQPVLDQYTPEFENVLSLVDAIMHASPERPSVCFDMGIIPPLTLVATGCRDYSVRWSAIEMLQSWPHREGTWDSNLCAQLAIQTMKVEAMNNFNVDVSGKVRGGRNEPSLRGIFMTVEDDQRWARISYFLGDVKHEVRVMLEEDIYPS
ncbi:C6 zinc finger domain protein [Aspergillus costaricaensis CBS 115574]|uniref:C6 zinc finger domain protein n=1 Tax=Aspergillus costaricaensis CBS 115574 TaxID=1448317 RepID=A0ACD1I5L7_9EURO|nr:C6 zinc finger domain protein [Aspergillus costaricaensis CBS 115574]RAK85514.1 C6 zinc finger domain protein [Aspergillus costaricaensis CBS 115574]